VLASYAAVLLALHAISRRILLCLKNDNFHMIHIVILPWEHSWPQSLSALNQILPFVTRPVQNSLSECPYWVFSSLTTKEWMMFVKPKKGNVISPWNRFRNKIVAIATTLYLYFTRLSQVHYWWQDSYITPIFPEILLIWWFVSILWLIMTSSLVYFSLEYLGNENVLRKRHHPSWFSKDYRISLTFLSLHRHFD